MENAANAGASAVLMYTDARPKTVMGGTATDLTTSIPGVMIDNAPGLAILAELDAMAAVNASLDAGNFITEQLEGNIMAGFSSRGEYATEPDWIKPDITAPGVRILAASTPDRNNGTAGDFFSYLQGTSMSTPHIAGLGALIKQAHPHLSGAQIKSALMTTARQDVVKEDGTTPADPFDFGSGHVNPNKAIDPGLTYDAGLLDYLAASCGTVTPLLSPGNCDFVENALGLSTHPADLNLPSIAISALPGTQTIRRTVTGVKRYRKEHKASDYEPREYHAQVQAPAGFNVEVSPSMLYLGPGQSASYDVTITNETANPGEWHFGELVWRENTKGANGRHDPQGMKVRSPIAVRAQAFVVPEEVSGKGESGSGDFKVTFGYTGEYTAGTHGLNDAGLWLSTVEDDPGNSFQFLGPGTAIAFLAEVPEGTGFSRWSTFNEYTTGDDDIDLYLYYCPNFLCSFVDSSGNADSNEEVSVAFPLNDPAITDPYLVFTHGFNTEGGLPADVILFAWDVGIDDDAGNMTVTAPTSAAIGTTETITVDWAGLSTGPGAKQLGAVSHSDANGIQEATLISITNDDGGTICDLIACP
jgi:hypothetical protein